MTKNVEQGKELTPLQKTVHLLSTFDDNVPNNTLLSVADYLTMEAVKAAEAENKQELTAVSNGLQLLGKFSVGRSMAFKNEMLMVAQNIQYVVNKLLPEESAVDPSSMENVENKVSGKTSLLNAFVEDAEVVESELATLIKKQKEKTEENKYTVLEFNWRSSLAPSPVAA